MGEEMVLEQLLEGYRQGIFPMSESRDNPELFWVNPKDRGIFPIDGFHLSRSLKRRLVKVDYEVRVSSAFEEVVAACAERTETWINQTIIDLYCALAAQGKAHSVEIWQENNLIGGVYGVVDGAAFFGESMFSRKRDASKMALAYLMHRLVNTGYILFDTQFLTSHLASLGAINISRTDYHARLRKALTKQAHFLDPNYSATASEVTQRIGQTS